MNEPNRKYIEMALRAATRSPCRSKRGVVLWSDAVGEYAYTVTPSSGFNGPPGGAPCPGRAVCGGNCGRRCVHAEMRALREAMFGYHYHGTALELLHVELASDGGVVACSGPSCETCAREILDVGFVAGVWLYELSDWLGMRVKDGQNFWRRYTAAEFYAATLKNLGIPT